VEETQGASHLGHQAELRGIDDGRLAIGRVSGSLAISISRIDTESNGRRTRRGARHDDGQPMKPLRALGAGSRKRRSKRHAQLGSMRLMG
jgi:hypothetical protein